MYFTLQLQFRLTKKYKKCSIKCIIVLSFLNVFLEDSWDSSEIFHNVFLPFINKLSIKNII